MTYQAGLTIEYCNPACDPSLGGKPDSGCYDHCGRFKGLAALKDAAGNAYRNQGGEWQVLKQGIGWSAFAADVDIELSDGTLIPASVKEPSAPKYSEAEKSILISHARDLHMQAFAAAIASGGAEPETLANDAVTDAKALVEALRNEGVL